MRARCLPSFLACLSLSVLWSNPVRACGALDLHVDTSFGRPPVFTTTPGVAFPHTRTTALPSELYRAGDVTGSDSLTRTLLAVKGPGAGQVTLHVPGACATRAPTFADTGVALRDLHVDATRGSASGDGSLATPFDTIQRAAPSARPGDRIVVHAGNYPGSSYVVNLTGTAANPCGSRARPVSRDPCWAQPRCRRRFT